MTAPCSPSRSGERLVERLRAERAHSVRLAEATQLPDAQNFHTGVIAGLDIALAALGVHTQDAQTG